MILRDKLAITTLATIVLSISIVVVLIKTMTSDRRSEVFYQEPIIGEDETFELESMSLTSITNVSEIQQSPSFLNRNISINKLEEAVEMDSRVDNKSDLSLVNFVLGIIMFICIAIISVLTVLGLLSIIY